MIYSHFSLENTDGLLSIYPLEGYMLTYHETFYTVKQGGVYK